MLRKRGKKCVYTLPRINPRAANLNSTDDAQKLGREIQDDVMEILDYAFNPIPEGEEDRIQVCYDGSDIPDDNTRRNRGTGDRKRNQAPTGQNNTVTANIGQNSNRTHHMINFDNRKQHRATHLKFEVKGTSRTGQENQPPQKTVVRKQAQQKHLHHGERHSEKEGN